MDIDECVNLLRDRVRQLHPCNSDGIVAYIVSHRTPVEIRQYLLASDEQMHPLIIEAASSMVVPVQHFSQLTPLQPPSWGYGLPYSNSQPPVHPSVSCIRFQGPLPIDQTGPLHRELPQFHPSNSFLGVQAPFPLIGATRAFRRLFSEVIDIEKHLQSLSIPDDTMPCSHGTASESATGYALRSSKTWTKPSDFHFDRGYCKKGENCLFSHEPGFHEMHKERRVHSLESLFMLDKEIRELLRLLRPPMVPIESLANMYVEKYGKPLQIEGFSMEGHQHGSDGCSLICLLLGLKDTSIIKRKEQHYVVPVEDVPKYLADDFKLVTPPASSGSNQIYITFTLRSMCTKRDAWNYFSRYGTVNDVRLMRGEKHMFGFVSFLHSETVKLILSEKSPRTPHFICGDHVFVKAYKEKHELEKYAWEDTRSKSGACRMSEVKVIHEIHTEESLSAKHQSFGEKLNSGYGLGIVTEKGSIKIAPQVASPPNHKLYIHSSLYFVPYFPFLSIARLLDSVNLLGDHMTESSHVSTLNRLDKASADQKRDD